MAWRDSKKTQRQLKPKNVLPKWEWIHVKTQHHDTIKNNRYFRLDSHRNIQHLSDKKRSVGLFLYLNQSRIFVNLKERFEGVFICSFHDFYSARESGLYFLVQNHNYSWDFWYLENCLNECSLRWLKFIIKRVSYYYLL